MDEFWDGQSERFGLEFGTIYVGMRCDELFINKLLMLNYLASNFQVTNSHEARFLLSPHNIIVSAYSS